MSKRSDQAASLAILIREADLRMADIGRAQDSAVSRSAVVVGAAVVAAGLQVSGHHHGLWHALPVAFALLSALLALMVLRYRRALALAVGALADHLADHTPETLTGQVLRARVKILRHEERALKVQARWLLASYVCLTLAIGAVAVQVILANV